MADARGSESATVDGDRPAGDERRPGIDGPLGFAVVTVSGDRGIEDDEPTGEIVSAVEAADHEVAVRERIDASHDNVQSAVSRLVDRDDVDLVVAAGSTGIEPSDVTVEAVRPILEKDLPTFRYAYAIRAIERIGTRAIGGRTEAGIVDGVPVFCLPGNAEATRLAIEELIEPEAVRLVATARGDEDDD
ncbi:molybdenum cofactor biosynthesis protein B [Halovivax sp.]|uniref:MogA/MoaB family molybdenum cofactor biosynthesis protein n=1 Tax=Halovivax sp. TaxID=1935978 RepID=UPI0025C4AEDB|nr:molybdopterin-binding protein [Halovivax sp.]